MAREQFDKINDAFLQYDFDGQFAQLPHQYGDDGEYESLVKAAYVARGELGADQVDNGNIDLNEAMHMGEDRVAHWVGRLANGELEPDQLLTRMLEEAQAGNDGLNEDPTHIDFRVDFAEALQNEIREQDLHEDQLVRGDLLQTLIDEKRQEVGVEVAERHGERYSLDDLPEAPREWHLVDVDDAARKTDLVDNGELRQELQSAVGIQISSEALENLSGDIQEDLEGRRIPDSHVDSSFEFREDPNHPAETEVGNSFNVTGAMENAGEETGSRTISVSVGGEEVFWPLRGSCGCQRLVAG